MFGRFRAGRKGCRLSVAPTTPGADSAAADAVSSPLERAGSQQRRARRQWWRFNGWKVKKFLGGNMQIEMDFFVFRCLFPFSPVMEEKYDYHSRKYASAINIPLCFKTTRSLTDSRLPESCALHVRRTGSRGYRNFLPTCLWRRRKVKNNLIKLRNQRAWDNY